jgi:hypothetical protein
VAGTATYYWQSGHPQKIWQQPFYKWREIMNRKIFKSIGAVLAGFVTVFVLSVATDFVLEKIGFFPPANEPEAYTG